MSFKECDLTGSNDRVEPVHQDIKREGLNHVCFKQGVILENIRVESIKSFDNYQGFDKTEKIQQALKVNIDNYLKKLKGKKPVSQEESKKDIAEKKKPAKKKK